MKRYEPLFYFDWLMADENPDPPKSGFNSFIITGVSDTFASRDWTVALYVTFKDKQGHTFKKYYTTEGVHRDTRADAELTQRIFNRWRAINGREKDTGVLLGCAFAAYLNVRDNCHGKYYYDFGKYGDPLAKQYLELNDDFKFDFKG